MGKKKKNNQKDWSDDDDAAAILAKLDSKEEEEKDVAVPKPVSKSKSPKNKKKQQQDWSDDEDAAAILTKVDSKEAATTNGAADNEEEEEEDIPKPAQKSNAGKNNKKKKKQQQDFSDDDDAAAMIAKLDLQEMQEAELNEQKKSSNKDQKKNNSKPVVEKDDDDEPQEIRVKSKKEKEKERKERQKLAAKKQQEETKQKSETQEKEQKSTAEEYQADAAQDEKKKTKTKKKGAPIAALKQMLEAQKAAEEALRKQEEEERKRIEEEERRQKEEEAKKEEQRRLKKEEEKRKKEELKKAGKYLTPAQKKAQEIAQQKLQAMIESGSIKVEGLQDKSPEGTPQKKKKPIYTNKKKKLVAPKKEETKEAEVKDSWDQSEDGLQDSWDKLDDVIPIVPVTADSPAATDKKKETDDWDDSEDEDERPKSATNKTTAPSSPKNSTARQKEKPKSQVEEDSEEDDDDESEYSDDEELTSNQKILQKQKDEAAKKRQKRMEEAMAARSKDNLRSPICVILGHVDTGKTKLLDKIRQTNVQEGEAGGITQQIGATYFPMETIKQKTEKLKARENMEYKLPGLLVIDTPGHESFTNLRSRGSSLCNIAVLVVDIMHGLEPQTIESIGLLKQRKTPFIVALNKIDRIYGWKAIPNYPVELSLKQQPDFVIKEYQERVKSTMVAFAEQGLNSCLYYENSNFAKNVSLVPTSAITGEGIPDLLHLLVHLTQSRMTETLMYLSEIECTVLEVKVIEGLGTTIDVVLSNGILHEGDRIVLCGLNGPIATNIRALLTPQPLRELRVKSAYVKNKQVKAAMGLKISAPDLEKAIAGSRLLVIGQDDDEEALKEEVMSDLNTLMNSVDKTGKGVCVQASTLGSLEALLEFLRVSEIPVSGINIGPVHKKDVIRASVMLERAPEYSQILAFDVSVDKDAELLAEDVGVKIFKADIIYHLFDAYKAYMAEVQEQRRRDQAPQAVFPCILRVVPGSVFNKRSPIVVGVDVVEGQLRAGTPICVVNKEGVKVPLGRVTGIELNHKQRDSVKRGDPAVAIKIEVPGYETPKMYGRHFDQNDEFLSQLSRQSIDILKSTFRNDVSKEEWALIIKLKKKLNID